MLPNGWHETTSVEMGQDKLRRLESLNLSEHLHETMRACRAVRCSFEVPGCFLTLQRWIPPRIDGQLQLIPPLSQD